MTKLLSNFYERIKTISSFSDFYSRLKNLFILIYKISIGHYGEKYWKEERIKKIEIYENKYKETNDIKKHIEIISCYYKEKEYLKCKQVYSFVLTKTTTNNIPISIHMTMADTFFCLHDYDLAYNEYTVVLNTDKNSIQAIKGIVWILEKKQKFIDIINFLKPILENNYNSYLIIKIAYAYINLKDFTKANYYLNKIIENKDTDFYKDSLILSLYCNIQLQETNRIDTLLKELLKYFSLEETTKKIEQIKTNLQRHNYINSTNNSLEYNDILNDLFKAENKNSTDKIDEAISILKNLKTKIGNIKVNKQMVSNILTNELEIANKKTILSSKPRELTVVLTNKCNLNCIMCDMQQKSNEEISPKVLATIKDMLPFLKTIIWLGGETFLYKEFPTILKETYKYNIDQEIITNGLLLNKDIIKELLQNNINLTISIDGVTKEIYESIRVNGSFEKLLTVLEDIKNLKKELNSNSIIRLNALILKNNYKQIVDFLEFAHKYNFDTLAYNCLNEGSGNEQMDIFSKLYSNEIKKEIYNSIQLVKKKTLYYGIRIENTLPTKEYLDIVNENIFIKNFSIKENNSSLFCHIPYKKIFISANGDVYPSCFCKNKIGNLNNSSFDEVWNSKQMQEYRKRIIENNIKGFCSNSCIYERLDRNSMLY